MPTENFNEKYFPDYEILGTIGESNARVIKARHRLNGDLVAIKHLPFNIDEGTMRRFRREADLMTSLDHPSIVKIKAYHFESELPFMVMEWVEGGDLRSLLNKHDSLDVPTVIRLGLQIAESLKLIHQKGIIHRDIKPENILYRVLQNGEKHFLLTDFGISRLKGQNRSTGLSSLTYEYASPESFYDEENLSEASDFYSLGVVLYECLSGKVPYPLDSKGIGALIDAVKNNPLPPLGLPNKSIVPSSLAKLVTELLKKNPKNRLKDVEDIDVELSQAQVEWKKASKSSKSSIEKNLSKIINFNPN
jgi:serine/threonine-protein kinase